MFTTTDNAVLKHDTRKINILTNVLKVPDFCGVNSNTSQISQKRKTD